VTITALFSGTRAKRPEGGRGGRQGGHPRRVEGSIRREAQGRLAELWGVPGDHNPTACSLPHRTHKVKQVQHWPPCKAGITAEGTGAVCPLIMSFPAYQLCPGPFGSEAVPSPAHQPTVSVFHRLAQAVK
jgi:hypothetical protein